MESKYRNIDGVDIWISDQEVAAINEIALGLQDIPYGYGVRVNINGRDFILFIYSGDNKASCISNIFTIAAKLSKRLVEREDVVSLVDLVSDCESHPDLIKIASSFKSLEIVEILFFGILIEEMNSESIASFEDDL